VEEDPGAALLHVSGEVDLFTAPLLRDHLVRLVDERRGGIVVVLAEVQYMDMAGIRALEHGLRRAQERGSRLVLASPSPIVRRVFEIVGMQNQLPVLPTKTAALLHLAGGASG
jgi:anti-sigma B factor antagonist